jgi:hypothetical protein
MHPQHQLLSSTFPARPSHQHGSTHSAPNAIVSLRQTLGPKSGNIVLSKSEGAPATPLLLLAEIYLSFHDLVCIYCMKSDTRGGILKWFFQINLHRLPFTNRCTSADEIQQIGDAWAQLSPIKRQYVELAAIKSKYEAAVSLSSVLL